MRLRSQSGQVMTGSEAQGSSGELYGWFTHVTWEGISGASVPAYSAKAVSLIE